VVLIVLIQTACSKKAGHSGSAPPVSKPTPAQAIQACPTGAQPAECQSFLMTLTGKNGRPPHPNDLSAVANSIGSLISQLKTQNYIMIQMFPTGGFQACLDPIANGGYDAAVYVFSSFRVGSETS